MDNVINPTLQVLPSLSVADKVVMIDVARLPSNIKVGDMILLETLMNGGAMTPGSSEPAVTLNILADNQKIPLEPRGEFPLKFDTSATRQFVAKVVSENTLQLLSDKKSIFACNVNEDELADAISNPDAHPYVSQVKKYVAEHHNAEAIVISARIEEELIDVSEEESREFLESLGVKDSGVSDLIRAVYHLLGLRTYLTTGIKETRAWTIPAGAKAPQAAGVIHTDFERGFIAAEVVHYDDLVSCGGKAGAREHGKLRIEGKEYVVKDGDVIEFRFNV